MNLKRHFKPILLLFVMLLVQTIFNSADVTMLGLMKGDYEVGLYSIAVKITNLVCQLVNSILWVVLPQLTKLFIDEDFERINVTLRKIFQGFISLGFPPADKGQPMPCGRWNMVDQECQAENQDRI